LGYDSPVIASAAHHDSVPFGVLYTPPFRYREQQQNAHRQLLSHYLRAHASFEEPPELIPPPSSALAPLGSNWPPNCKFAHARRVAAHGLKLDQSGGALP
jgi:hypothetical protein